MNKVVAALLPHMTPLRRIPMTLQQARNSKRWRPRAFALLLLLLLLFTPSSGHRYEILSSVETREAYDMYGMEGVSGRGGPRGPGGTDAADIFAELFGGMRFGFDFGPGAGPRRSKGKDSVIPYDVTLEDLYNGKTVKMNMEKEVVCSGCKG